MESISDTNEPIWVPRIVVRAAHFEQLQEHGGIQGLRDNGDLLDTALARPVNKYAYEPNTDLADLAAAYGFAIAKTCHPFADGNKRVGFLVAATFLSLNGYEVEATDDAVKNLMESVADGTVSEGQLGHWFRSNMRTAQDSESAGL